MDNISFVTDIAIPVLIDAALSFCLSLLKSLFGQRKDVKLKELYFEDAKRQIAESLDEADSRAVIELLESKDGLAAFFVGLANSNHKELTGDINALFAQCDSPIKPDALAATKRILIQCGLQYLRDYHKEDFIIARLDQIEGIINAKFDEQKSLLERDRQQCQTPEKIDLVLQTYTRIPDTDIPLSLSFFEVENKECLEPVKNAKNGDICTVVYPDVEEAGLILCRFLTQETGTKNALIVHKMETWLALLSTVRDAYLICTFESTKPIPASSNNVTVFLRPSGEGFVGQTIKLQKSTIAFTEQKLKSIGVPDDQALTFVQKTGGLFQFMIALSWRGEYPLFGEYKEQEELIRFLLLCPSIPETEAGLSFISQFVKLTPEELRQNLDALCLGKAPVLVKTESSMYDRCRYYVPCLTALWIKFGDRVKKADFSWFIRSLFAAIEESHLPDRTIYKSIEALTLACCGYNEKWQATADSLVTGFLLHTTTQAGNNPYLKYLYYLAELSPRGVIDYLDETKEMLYPLFKENASQKDENGFPSFTDVCQALRRITFYGGDLAKEAYTLAADFAQNSALGNIKYSPKPIDVLEELFIPWLNDGGLSVAERSSLANSLMRQYPEATKSAIEKGLLARSSNGYGVGLTYRIEVEKKPATTQEYFQYRTALIDLLISESAFPEQAKLIQRASWFFFTDKQTTQLLGRIKTHLTNCSDDDRLTTLDCLRGCIYDNRYFEREWGKQHEGLLSEIEAVVNEAKFQEPLYRALPLFEPEPAKWLDMHPVPFNQDDDFYEKKEVRDKRIQRELKTITEGIDPFRFCSFLHEHHIKSDYATVQILPFVTDAFERSWFDAFVAWGFYNDADVYASRFFHSPEEWEELLQETNSPEPRARIILRLGYPASLTRIDLESPETQKVFWSLVWPDDLNKEALLLSLNRLYEHHHYAKIISFLHRNLDKVSSAELIENLYQAIDANSNLLRQCEYELRLCLEPLRGVAFNDADLWRKAALLDSAVSCQERSRRVTIAAQYWDRFPEAFAKDALSSYASFGKEPPSWQEKALRETIWLTFSPRYCPAVINGHVDYMALKEWAGKALTAFGEERGLFDHVMAIRLAHAPKDNPSLPCATAVAIYLNNDADQRLRREYAIALFNQTGLHTVDGGKTLSIMAQNYSKDAKRLAEAGYQRTARIYREISKDFYEQAEQEFNEGLHVR